MDEALFGWLTPKRAWVRTGQFNHIEVAFQRWDTHPEFQRALLPLELHRRNVAEVRTTCEAVVAAEGCSVNAEWHRYEAASSDLNNAVYWTLLRCGFIRVGSSRKALHFEGLPHGIHGNYQFCRSMAERHQKQAIFEPMKLPK